MSAGFRSSFAAPSGFSFSAVPTTSTKPDTRKAATATVAATRPRPATKGPSRPNGRR